MRCNSRAGRLLAVLESSASSDELAVPHAQAMATGRARCLFTSSRETEKGPGWNVMSGSGAMGKYEIDGGTGMGWYLELSISTLRGELLVSSPSRRRADARLHHGSCCSPTDPIDPTELARHRSLWRLPRRQKIAATCCFAPRCHRGRCRLARPTSCDSAPFQGSQQAMLIAY